VTIFNSPEAIAALRRQERTAPTLLRVIVKRQQVTSILRRRLWTNYRQTGSFTSGVVANLLKVNRAISPDPLPMIYSEECPDAAAARPLGRVDSAFEEPSVHPRQEGLVCDQVKAQSQTAVRLQSPSLTRNDNTDSLVVCRCASAFPSVFPEARRPHSPIRPDVRGWSEHV
jgi:hypothetical protein